MTTPSSAAALLSAHPLHVVRKRKFIALSIAGLLITGILIEYLMTATWVGGRDVEVKFGPEFTAQGAKLKSYENQHFRVITDILEWYRKDGSPTEGISLSLEPRKENEKTLMTARLSGKKGLILVHFEHLRDGFLGEIELDDGQLFYSWAQAEGEKPIIATFEIKNSQPVAVVNASAAASSSENHLHD